MELREEDLEARITEHGLEHFKNGIRNQTLVSGSVFCKWHYAFQTLHIDYIIVCICFLIFLTYILTIWDIFLSHSYLFVEAHCLVQSNRDYESILLTGLIEEYLLQQWDISSLLWPKGKTYTLSFHINVWQVILLSVVVLQSFF